MAVLLSDVVDAALAEKLRAARVTDDSRSVVAGDILVWDSRINPAKSAEIIADAKARGAALVVSDVVADGVVHSEVPGKVIAAWAAEKNPGQPNVMLGVTGTSGKTSVAWFGRQVASLCGVRAASVGTLGVMRSDDDADEEYTGFTSPTALKMHPILDTLKREGTELCVAEVSSHALDLFRVEGVNFRAAGLTNITQDHLDYHGTLEAYAAAKLRFFAELLPADGVAVVNALRMENLAAMAIAKERGQRVLSVGTANAELVVEVVRAHGKGLDVRLKFDANPVEAVLPLVGSFQAENLAVALGLLVGGGIGWEALKKAAVQVSGVPGRMEMVAGTGAADEPGVVVDYAHKPDALERALQSLRPLVKGKGKLICVFGCGGNRDATKRPLMGGIAARLADAVIVTDDNPRKEDAAEIRAQVMAGAKGAAHVREVGDRRAAIAAALEMARGEDVVLLAGKGHEQGQIMADEVLPFDDRVVVRELMGVKG